MQLEAMRAARAKNEEALALMQVQNTVQNLQQLDKIVQKSEQMVCQLGILCTQYRPLGT